ncbi:unnamed protein product [Macrosiphum euphorbiae]|uniref:Uncharacterized protein n=1 Tax=Macrosiphum euphorbiae TaxID=13131 RepID=A0AAV0WKL8_9HEMI|nr:unnamed protein product [Macrosiphum euphorbiae]
MSPVQVLVVFSMMIIINQAATLKYENQPSGAAGYDADKMAYEILNNKTYISNGNFSGTTSPYYYNATDFLENIDYSEINLTDIFEFINNSNETALPVLKSGAVTNILMDIAEDSAKTFAKELSSAFGKLIANLFN